MSLWVWLTLFLFSAVAEGIMIGLHRYYGPNIGDALRRRHIWRLEYELWQLQRAKDVYYIRSPWWHTGLDDEPPLADYRGLIRVIENEVIRTQATSATGLESPHAVASFPRLDQLAEELSARLHSCRSAPQRHADLPLSR